VTTTTATEVSVTAEAAYAHLASFRRGERVVIGGRNFYSEAVVTAPQCDVGPSIERACLIATDLLHPEVQTRVTIHLLLTGARYIEHDDGRKWDGSVTRFD
jgi:hypothetical protein